MNGQEELKRLKAIYHRCVGMVDFDIVDQKLIPPPTSGPFVAVSSNYSVIYDAEDLDLEGYVNKLYFLIMWGDALEHLLDKNLVKGITENEQAIKCFLSRIFFDVQGISI